MGSGLLQPMHVVVLLVVALLVLGPKRLPEVGKALGEGLKGFKSSMEGDHDPAPRATLADRPSADGAPTPDRAPAADRDRD